MKCSFGHKEIATLCAQVKMNQILYNFIYEKINYNFVREGINVDLCSEFNIYVYLDLFLAGNDKTNKQNVRYYTTFPFSPKKIKK